MAPNSKVIRLITEGWHWPRSKPLTQPTDAMVDAAHEAVRFDAFWAINSRADFKKAARAMVRATIET